ncbi:MAG: hypothetical protein RIQ54_119 [Candidatus Parcubacteria bacterium]|jgi:chromosome segregation protein
MPHFLKRLELNGFKSFATKTILEFPEGITAVVGPNGSGKSNIVDAIRWLLGERDAKSLRGGKIDDLIFSGTPHRSRVGQAQASLYFENHNHFFPVDFEEVSAGRLVNRDGESKYFLNRSEVLLRELVDFFARVRLGSKGLVVVTQGNSDLFIQSTPVARREMLEEILGLKEYQIKRTDAQRRLRQSVENLENVQALTQEIVPHLRSLKRQTERWSRRDEILLALSQAEQRYYGSQLKEIHDMLHALSATYENEQAAVVSATTARERAQALFNEIESRKPADANQVQQLRTQTQQLLEQKSILERESGRLDARIESLAESATADIHASDYSSVELVAVLRDVQTRVRDALQGNDPMALRPVLMDIISTIDDFFKKTELPRASDKRAELDALRAQSQTLVEQINHIAGELDTIRVRQQEIEQQSGAYYQEFKDVARMVEQAKDEEARVLARIKTVQFEKERYTMRLEELRRHIEQSGKREDDFINFDAAGVLPDLQELTTLEARIFRIRGELAQMGEVDPAIIAEAHETQTRYDFLSREITDLQKAITDLHAVIAELRDKIDTEFTAQLASINKEFSHFFQLMFGGGDATLSAVPLARRKSNLPDEQLQDVSDEPVVDDIGIEISISLPRKRIASLDVLSGGERSLVGIAALFALISVSPPPFLVLDEVDAPLDERNARRFSELLRSFSKKTQFIVVTHNRVTMEAADVLYGITLDSDGTSKVVSLKLQ